jgi:AraC-like DNA-binding protein
MATEHIEANCLATLRLADLAALVGLSETYFSHAFKAATGLPPHRWVMHARVRKAQHFLSSTDLTLSAVAASSGFSDQAHLTRVFKAVIGTTPAAWRRDKTVQRP